MYILFSRKKTDFVLASSSLQKIKSFHKQCTAHYFLIGSAGFHYRFLQNQLRWTNSTTSINHMVESRTLYNGLEEQFSCHLLWLVSGSIYQNIPYRILQQYYHQHSRKENKVHIKILNRAIVRLYLPRRLYFG